MGGRGMKWALMLLWVAVVVLVGCCRPCGGEVVTVRDSVGRDVRREVLWVRDTVMVRLPAERSSAVVRDSSSRLETRYAVSEAGVRSDGTLWHWLEQKATIVPVEVAHREERRDSVVWREREDSRENVVWKEHEMSWWERTQLYWGRLCGGLLVLYVLRRWGLWWLKSRLKL